MRVAGRGTGPPRPVHRTQLVTRLCTVVAAFTATCLTTFAYAGDLVLGRAKAEAVCQTCHGLDGQATLAMAANLSGQEKEYMVIQLKAFRDGKRQHPQMSIVAQNLSDEDIENVALWYSSIRVTVEMPE